MPGSTCKSICFALVTLIAVMSGSGCSDVPTSADESPSLKIVPSDKVRHGNLMDRAVKSSAGKNGAAEDSVQLVVGFSSVTVTAEKIVSRYKIVSPYKIVSRYEYNTVFPGMAITVPASELDGLISFMDGDDEISWIEPDIFVPVTLPTVKGINPGSQQLIPWGNYYVEAYDSWARSGDGKDERGAANVDIYVLDTGVSHNDLNVVECLELNAGTLRSCVTPVDLDGHGTEVAGFAAARDNRTGIVGVAPGAPIHAIKVLDRNGEAESSDLIAVIEFLTERKLANRSKPMVVNVSFGADIESSTYNAFDEAIQKSIDAGAVYVIAAGNDGKDVNTYMPAHVADAITVGSYNKFRTLSWFSNKGALVDILAPGEDLEALHAGNSLVYSSGTSLSAPYVAGAAALLLQKYPWMNPRQVRDAIVIAGDSKIKAPWGTTSKSLDVGNF